MKVLKLGNDKEFIVGCNNCKTTFSYKITDVFKDDNNKLKDSIKCINCKSLIIGLAYKEK